MFDKNCHIMAIVPLYAIKLTLSLTCIEDDILMVVALFGYVALLSKLAWFPRSSWLWHAGFLTG